MPKWSKAYTVATVGILGWFTAVIASPSTAVTASEWLAGGTVLVAIGGVWLVPNGESVPPS